MKFQPHKYQSYAVDFVVEHPVSALILECGLGKTSITLSAINELMYNRFEICSVLVVCPLRVANTWRDEIRKWDDFHNLTYSIAIGDVSERISALKRRADI